MSQPFEARLTVVGSPEVATAFSDRIIKDWGGDKPPPGFRWIQKERPCLEATKRESNLQITYSFVGDGPAPESWAIVLSSEFPSLRIYLLAADSSKDEWLASAIAAYGGTWARASFKPEELDLPEAKDNEAVFRALATKLGPLHKVIGNDGELTEEHTSALCTDYECGKLSTSLFRATAPAENTDALDVTDHPS